LGEDQEGNDVEMGTKLQRNSSSLSLYKHHKERENEKTNWKEYIQYIYREREKEREVVDTQ